MEMMEIILLIAGGIIFVLSFFIPDGKGKSGGADGLAEQEVKKMVSQELEAVRNHVDDVVEEAVTYSMEKTERSLERLSNEKIMAVNEYSDTVLKEIHKNHEEAMFLYDMLNNKHTNLKETITELNGAVKAAEEVLNAVSRAGAEASVMTGSAAAEENVPEAEPEGSFVSMAAQQEEMERPKDVWAELLPENTEEGVNNNEKILKLYRRGKSAMDIARELGLGIGEVKLVIDLFRNQ
jgi:DNA-binding NarL/FixJ family response regulator